MNDTATHAFPVTMSNIVADIDIRFYCKIKVQLHLKTILRTYFLYFHADGKNQESLNTEQNRNINVNTIETLT